MDTGPPVYLACPERGLKLAIGRPRYDAKNRMIGFFAPADRPQARPTRRVRFQAVSKLAADSSADSMSFHDAQSAALHHLREIGGRTQEGGIPFPDYLPDQPIEWVTYYGLLVRGSTRKRTGAVIRRREFAGGAGSEDEVFTRRLRWERDHHLAGYVFGHQDTDHIEISEGEALWYVLRMLLSRLPFVKAG